MGISEKKNRKENDRKYAVITGASSGIGMYMAREMAIRGYTLILVARRKERLLKLKARFNKGFKCQGRLVRANSVVFQADVTKKKDVKALIDYISDKDVEVFINNAGFGDCGKFAETDISKEKDMIATNVTAMHTLFKLVLQQMRKRDSGYILNVASSAGLMPAGPYMATYYATKSYVTSLTKAVAYELLEEGSSVYVGCLCPGPVDTEFNNVANVSFALPGISAKDCARYAATQMFRGQVVIVPSLRMKLAVMAAKIVPENITIAITSRQQLKKMD